MTSCMKNVFHAINTVCSCHLPDEMLSFNLNLLLAREVKAGGSSPSPLSVFARTFSGAAVASERARAGSDTVWSVQSTFTCKFGDAFLKLLRLRAQVGRLQNTRELAEVYLRESPLIRPIQVSDRRFKTVRRYVNEANRSKRRDLFDASRMETVRFGIQVQVLHDQSFRSVRFCFWKKCTGTDEN